MFQDDLLSATSISWLASPSALIELDRELVRRGGLRAFVELAWHIIEPAATFRPNWHIDEMCIELERIVAGQNRRLAMAIPPRHGKSSILAVFFPAYVWIKNPARRMMFISYDFDLSMRDSKRTRELINSQWFQERWGHIFQLKTDNVKILETNKTGYRECASVGGRIMGKGADIICVDDPHDTKDVESEVKRAVVLLYWRERVQSRLNDPKTGSFVVCHQRVGENDLIGDILKRQKGQYVYLRLAVKFDPKHLHNWPRDPRTDAGELLWADHMPQPVIDEFETNLGSYAFAAQFQQLPGPREGGMFKAHWFTKISKKELPGDIEYCRGWDFAATLATMVKADPDYTATVLIGHSRTTKKWYIAHAERWRVEMGEVDRILVAKAQNDPKGTRVRLPQDPGAAGKGMVQHHGKLLAGYSFMAEPVTGDKAQNAAPLAGQAMVGNVMMVEGDWNDDYLAEMAGFPTASHDDWVDASSQAYKGFMKSTSGIMDYYSRMLEEEKAKALDVKPLDGSTIETTQDMGKAYSTQPASKTT
jgi:predicted phage terminase large subunit-like protein